MMIRVAIVVALALQACGPRSPDSDPPGVSTTGPDRGPSDPQPADPGPGCPASFDYAMHGLGCEQGGHCVYAEAECWCQAKQECTGVDLGPDQRSWLEWSCRVSDPTVRRPDGCPAKAPEQEDQPCEQDGQVCVYSPYCGGIQTTSRCVNGIWQLQQVEISAPPSSEG
jgi:hypothetical protein